MPKTEPKQMTKLIKVKIADVKPGTRFSLHEDGWDRCPLHMLDQTDELTKVIRKRWKGLSTPYWIWLTWEGRISWGGEHEVWVEEKVHSS